MTISKFFCVRGQKWNKKSPSFPAQNKLGPIIVPGLGSNWQDLHGSGRICPAFRVPRKRLFLVLIVTASYKAHRGTTTHRKSKSQKFPMSIILHFDYYFAIVDR